MVSPLQALRGAGGPLATVVWGVAGLGSSGIEILKQTRPFGSKSTGPTSNHLLRVSSQAFYDSSAEMTEIPQAS